MFCAFLFDLVLSIRSLCSRQTTIMLIFFYRTSLFITCSGLYGLFLFVVCIAFLAAEISTHSVPLHYFEVHYQRNFVLLHYTVFYNVDVLFFSFRVFLPICMLCRSFSCSTYFASCSTSIRVVADLPRNQQSGMRIST